MTQKNRRKTRGRKSVLRTFWLVPLAVDEVSKVLVMLGHPGVCDCSRFWGWTILEVFTQFGNTKTKGKSAAYRARLRSACPIHSSRPSVNGEIVV